MLELKDRPPSEAPAARAARKSTPPAPEAPASGAVSAALRRLTSSRNWSLPARLALAAIVVLAAFGVRLTLLTGLDAPRIYITLFPAVTISAVLGRRAAGFLAIGLGAVLSHAWLAQLGSSADWLGLLTFALGSILIIAVAEALHATLDVLEVREASDARFAAASQLAAIVETTDDAVIGFDTDGYIFSWNSAAERLFGYTAEEAIGQSADLLVAPLGKPPAGEGERGAFDIVLGGGRFVRDTVRVAKDGTRIDVSLAATQIRDEEGRILGVSAIIRDIRARRRAELALRESEQRLRRFVADAPVAIAMLDRDLRYVAASRRWASDYGLDLDRLVGRYHYEAHPELPERYKAVHQRALAGEVVSAEDDPFPKADGTPRWVRWEVRPWHDADARVGGIIILNEDVTPQVQAIRELRESREDLKRAQSIARIGSWRLDVVRNQLTWSEENHRVFGVPPGTPLTYETFLGVVHPDDRGYVDERWHAALRGEPYDIEHRIVVDGETRWVRECAELEIDAEGSLRGGFGTTQDITAKKQVEAALSESEAQLRFALTGANAAAWRWNIATGEQTWSPEGFRLHGLDPAKGSPNYETWLNCLHPDDRVPIETVIDDCQRHRISDFRSEYRVVLPSGEMRWLAAYGKVDFDGQGHPVTMSGINLDITERRTADELLSAAKQRLEAHIDNSPLAFVEFDRDFRISRWSKAAERLWGWTAEEVVGKSPGDFRWVHDADVERIGEVMKALTSGADPRVVVNNRNYRKDGTIVDCEWYNSAIYDSNGRLVSILSQVLDVTERYRAERDLRMSEQRLRLALSGANAGVWDWEPHANRVNWSPECFEIFGLDAGAGVPKYADWLQLVHPEDRERVGAELGRLIEGEQVHYELEYRIVSPQRGVRWLSSPGRIERDGGGRAVRLVGLNIDITERKQAEAALALSEQRFRLLFEQAVDGIFIADAAGRYLSVNSAGCQMLGYTRDELTRMSIAEVVAPDELARIAPEVERLSSGAVARTEWRFRRKDGSIFFGEVVARQVPDGQLQAFVRDVTERQRVLEQLRLATVELEKRVAERTAALEDEMRQRQAAQAALAQTQRLDALGRLAGGLTHDFNNTLAAVNLHVELATSRIDDPIALDCLHKALDAVKMGASLNRRLLSFARRGQPVREVVDTHEPVATLVGLLKRSLDQDVSLDLRVADALWPTRLDRGELESALLNLAINARDAMPDGGVLTVEAENVTLDAACAAEMANGIEPEPGEFVRLTVRDTGIGMPADVLARVGEPFFTTKAPAKGTGLGLSSVREFVNNVGGMLAIESRLGQGTAVSIFLQRDASRKNSEVAMSTSIESAEIPLGDGELVLLVEDDERVLEAAHILIEGLGYAVLDARSGDEAMQLLADDAAVAVVLSDILMPGGMSGYDIARRVTKEHPEIGVVLASGFEGDVKEGDEPVTGVQTLRKPYGRRDLATAIRAAIKPAGG